MLSPRRKPTESRVGLTLAVALTSALLIAACANKDLDGAQTGSTSTEKRASESQAQGRTTPADDDWLHIGEETLLPVLDELGANLQAAHYALDREDPTSAAAEMRRGADVLESEIGKATPDQKDRLLAAAASLRDVADRLARGDGIDESSVNHAFQDAYAADTQERWKLLDEDMLLPHADAPENYFLGAERALSEENTQLAAQELRKALVFIRLETSRADKTTALDLQQAEGALGQLADQMRTGDLAETGDFERAVANASLALAEFHLSRARAASPEDRSGTVASGIENCSAYLRRAAVWAGVEIDPDLETALVGADHLVEGSQNQGVWETQQMASTVESLGSALTTLRQEVGSHAALGTAAHRPG